MANSINLSRKTLMLAKMETAYNTAATPASSTTSSNAMVLYDETNPVQIDTKVVDRQVIRASYSKNSNLKGRQLYMIQPKTMLMASPGVFYNPSTGTYDGHTGEAPPGSGVKASFLDVLFRACGMQATMQASSLSIVYTPRSSGFESATIWTYMDGIIHKAYGCVGNMTFEGRAGEGIDVSFDLKGNMSATVPTYSTNPATVYPQDRKIMAEQYAMTVSNFGVSSTSPIVRSFRFDPGNQIIERADLNSTKGLYGLYIVDRQPKLDLTIEVDSQSGWDPFTSLASSLSSDLVAVDFKHGVSTTGERWHFSFPQCQTRDVKHADDQGVRLYNISYDIVASTDDADWMIVQY